MNSSDKLWELKKLEYDMDNYCSLAARAYRDGHTLQAKEAMMLVQDANDQILELLGRSKLDIYDNVAKYIMQFDHERDKQINKLLKDE